MKIFAVIGNPIVHSKSPRMHNNAIKALNLKALYLRYELLAALKLKESLFALGLAGANITLPFKEEALKIADIKDAMALNIGSANTLIIKEKQIYAYNTDGIGFLKAIQEFKNIKRALILGAGGTAKALAFVLAQNGIEVYVANRSKERLKAFKAFKAYTYEELKNKDFDILINTTAAGLKDEFLPCDEALLKSLCENALYAFDAIYAKQTAFLSFCQAHHLQCKDGLDMLLWQGIFAFKLFFELDNQEELIKKAMQEALALK